MTRKKPYHWQRLWVPGTGTAVDEVLTHPDYFTSAAGAEVLNKWRHTPCLILLGEPGMGKSAEWTRQRLAETAPNSFALNLGDFSSGRDITETLTAEPAVRRWLSQPGSDLWLWLDSFDEALLHEAKIAQALLRMLRNWPQAGLHLRLLSRTATWPAFFTEELATYFKTSAGELQSPPVVVLQLAPLTRAQVQQAAEDEGIKAEAFLAAVARAEAVPLAVRPVTLALLLRLWQANRFGADVGRGIELLEAGCRLLCEEGWDEQRTSYGRVDADRRLRVAAQLALIMVASGRRALITDPLADDTLYLRRHEVTGEPTLFQDKPELILTNDLVDEVLTGTSLFVPTGGQVRWSHPVFADFLAAWALHQAQVAPPQLRNLLRSAVPGAGVVPALRDAAVWLASLSPTFAADLVQLDPLTALRADVLTSGPTQRAALVEQLLTLTTERHQYLQRAEPYLARLAHPGLAAQLEAVLRDPTGLPEARWLAYKTVQSCYLRELVPLLLAQTLDPALATEVRTDAIRTLHYLGGPDDAQPLRPLLAALPADDESAEFKGTLLRLLWPASMTVQELLPLLTPQRQANVIGAYHAFLDSTYAGGLYAGLTAGHLPALLRWVLRRPRPSYGTDEQVGEFVRNAVVAAAWQHTEDVRVLPLLALVLRLLLKYSSVPQVVAEGAPRRRVVSCWVQRWRLPRPWALTQRYQVAPRRYGRQDVAHQALVDVDDFEFVLELLIATTHHDTATILFETALALLDEALAKLPEQFQARFLALYTLAQTRGLDAGRSWVWEREEQATRYARNSFREQRDVQQAKQLAGRQESKWNRRTLRLLVRYTTPGRPNLARDWGRVYWLLTRTGGGRQGYVTTTTELREGVMWPHASPLLQQRLAELARRAVLAAPPRPEPDQAYDSFSEPEAQPLAALLLCQDECPQALAAFTAAEWQPWLRALLFGWVSVARRTELFAVALTHHRRQVLRQLAGEQDFWQQVSAETYGYKRLNEVLLELPDALVWRVALREVMSGRWSRPFSQAVLEQLLKLRFRSAELYRDSLLTPPPAPAWPVLTYAAFYEALFGAAPASNWWGTWQLLLRCDPVLVITLLGRLQGTPSWTIPLPTHLPDAQLVALLRWTVQDQGITEENDPADWRLTTPASRRRTFRNSVAKLLAGRATAPAWQALQELAIAYQYPRWLTYTLEEARETYSRLNWEPLAPRPLQQFLRHAANRWVQSSADLLEAVLESLDRLQQRLQGEPARAHALWYPAGQASGYRIVRGNKVRDENYVTDYVKSFLDDDLRQHLFATHREVQLRAGAGGQQGQELDLYVEAVARPPLAASPAAARLTVFIEAKHYDNPEVYTALRGQLVNRYLRNHSAQVGLFLVYWHRRGPDQRGQVNKLEDLRQLLARQAQQASTGAQLIKSYILDIRLPDDQV